MKIATKLDVPWRILRTKIIPVDCADKLKYTDMFEKIEDKNPENEVKRVLIFQNKNYIAIKLNFLFLMYRI